jgi:hypothetical protein
MTVIGGDLLVSGVAYDSNGNTFGSGGPTFLTSSTAGSVYTTGSFAFVGNEVGVDAPSDKGTDVNFYVKGTAGSRGTATAGTALFSGDLYVSGTVYSNEFKSTIISSSIIYSSGSTLFGNSADDTHTFIGNITGSADMLLTGSLTVKGSVTLPGTIYLTGPGGQNIIHDGGSGNLSLYSNSGNVYIEGTLFNGNDVAILGDLQVNGGDLTTPASTMNIFNSAAYINFGIGAEIRMGSSASTTIMYGSLSVEGSTSLGNASSDRTDVTGSFRSPIISGSLTRLTTGLSYLVAGSNVTITTASNGQVTIASTGGGGSGGVSYFESAVSGAIYSTGSLALAGTEGITNAASKGTDNFFYVSGSIGGRGAAQGRNALFGGDVVVSGSAYVSSSLFFNLGSGIDSIAYSPSNASLSINASNDLIFGRNGNLQFSGGSNSYMSFDGEYVIRNTNNGDDSSKDLLTITTPVSYTSPSIVVGNADYAGASFLVRGDVQATGYVTASLGFTGSLTRLTDGRSYLAAGSNVTITSESNGQVTISSAGGGGGSPGGSNTYVQFNDSGSFGAVSGLTFEKATSTLTGVTISATTGFTGSHTKLADGTSLIAAGVTSATSQTGSIAVTTGSSGQITVASYVFPSDLTVSLSGGRTFGRYATGETIPATGKTPAEVILLAIAQPINPTVATPTATNILTSVWNTTGSVNTSLTGSYTINTLGASVASARLEFRSGSSGTWSILTTSTSTPLLFDHTFTVGANFTSTLNYSHIVVDSAGAAATGSVTLTPQTYTSPTIPTITLARTTLGGITGEGNTTRERGNTVSAITGTITRQRTNAPLSSYAVQYRVDGTGAYIGVPGLSGSIPAASSTFTFMGLHNETSLLTSVSSSLVYIVSVVDTWQTSSITPSANGITFLSTIFYGTGATAPTTSADVRGLTNKVFTTTANPFTLNTGATNRFFTVALPTRNTSHDTITSVTDTDALGADITANYVNSAFSVGDGGGVNSTYNVYTMEVATPYAADHRHIVTRA